MASELARRRGGCRPARGCSRPTDGGRAGRLLGAARRRRRDLFRRARRVALPRAGRRRVRAVLAARDRRRSRGGAAGPRGLGRSVAGRGRRRGARARPAARDGAARPPCRSPPIDPDLRSPPIAVDPSPQRRRESRARASTCRSACGRRPSPASTKGSGARRRPATTTSPSRPDRAAATRPSRSPRRSPRGVAADPEALALVARASGGRVFPADRSAALVEATEDGLPGARRRVRPANPMRSPWWVVPFAGLLCAEWALPAPAADSRESDQTYLDYLRDVRRMSPNTIEQLRARSRRAGGVRRGARDAPSRRSIGATSKRSRGS